MPRSFLVKRSKADAENDVCEHQTGDKSSKELDVSTSQDAKTEYNQPPKNNWYIEYHPAASHFIPAKRCNLMQHSNGGSCYICSCPYQHVLPPATKGCIKYAPAILTQPHVNDCNNNVCYCPMCQHKVAQQIACNCRSCLKMRQPIAPPALVAHHKLPPKSPLCCNMMQCEHAIELSKYAPFCHCEQCIKGRTRFVMQAATHNDYIHSRAHLYSTRDNIQSTVNTDEDHKPQAKVTEDNTELRITNGLKSDKETAKQVPGETGIEMGKRKLEEPIMDLKRIKGENVKGEAKINEDIEQRELDKTKFEVFENGIKDNEGPPSLKERLSPKEYKQETEDTNIFDKNIEEVKKENPNNESTSLTDDPKDTGDHTITEAVHMESHGQNNFRPEVERVSNRMGHFKRGRGGRGRRYNTRHATSKPRTYDTGFIVPAESEWSQDQDTYSEVTTNRQKSKLNRLLANEHERRRVAQLNGAYQDLRQLIPGYQCDTKLPKIKILRYAINYIAHLDDILADPI